MRLTRHSSLRYDKAVVRKLISLVCLAASGCGYHLANSQLNEGAGSTIAVPTFINKTTTYRIEQRLAEEVRRELIRRTRFKVVSDNAGDLTRFDAEADIPKHVDIAIPGAQPLGCQEKISHRCPPSRSEPGAP